MILTTPRRKQLDGTHRSSAEGHRCQEGNNYRVTCTNDDDECGDHTLTRTRSINGSMKCTVIAALPQRGDKKFLVDVLQAMQMTRESSDHFMDFVRSHVMLAALVEKSCSVEDTRSLSMLSQVVCDTKDADVRAVRISTPKGTRHLDVHTTRPHRACVEALLHRCSVAARCCLALL